MESQLLDYDTVKRVHLLWINYEVSLYWESKQMKYWIYDIIKQTKTNVWIKYIIFPKWNGQ